MRGLREKYDNVYRNCQDGKSEFRNATGTYISVFPPIGGFLESQID